MSDNINYVHVGEIKTFQMELEEKYPIIAEEFKNIQKEQYDLFAQKMLSYGKGNISLGSNLETTDEKIFSLTGLVIRLTDKINRLKNLVITGKNYIQNETIEDTFIDVATYGIIGMIVGRDKWK